MTSQEFAASLMAVAMQLTARILGVADVAPDEITVVVPGVTAPIVG